MALQGEKPENEKTAAPNGSHHPENYLVDEKTTKQTTDSCCGS
jgi:hypothetical protein